MKVIRVLPNHASHDWVAYNEATSTLVPSLLQDMLLFSLRSLTFDLFYLSSTHKSDLEDEYL